MDRQPARQAGRPTVPTGILREKQRDSQGGKNRGRDRETAELMVHPQAVEQASRDRPATWRTAYRQETGSAGLHAK